MAMVHHFGPSEEEIVRFYGTKESGWRVWWQHNRIRAEKWLQREDITLIFTYRRDMVAVDYEPLKDVLRTHRRESEPSFKEHELMAINWQNILQPGEAIRLADGTQIERAPDQWFYNAGGHKMNVRAMCRALGVKS